MNTEDFLKILKNEIHSTVISTVDGEGLPAARVIDVMLADEEGIYFLTARGKAFYEQLQKDPNVVVTGMTPGSDSMKRKSISMKGKVRPADRGLLEDIFRENTYMADIYPGEASRMALEVFQLYEGVGEYFDLSAKPIFRETFFLNQEVGLQTRYEINDNCTGCGACLLVCPQSCISSNHTPYVIRQESCLHCGNCLTECRYEAVEKR